LHRLGRAGETSLGKRSLHTLNGRDCAANSQFTQPSVYRLPETSTLSDFHGFLCISERKDLNLPQQSEIGLRKKWTHQRGNTFTPSSFPRVYTAANGAESLSKISQNPEAGGDWSQDAPAPDHQCAPTTETGEPRNTTPPGNPRPEAVSQPAILTEVTRKAMATEFAILLPPQSLDAVELAVTTLERLDQIEQTLTIYDNGSEVSQINRTAGQGPAPASKSTFQLIERAQRWSQRTRGAFDITAGPLVKAWGFTERSGRKPSTDEVEAALAKVGYHHLHLNREHQTVQFDLPEMSINLGGIGKGDALDQIADELRRGGLNDFLLHGGSSSVLAAGDQTANSGLGWAIGIAHPTKPKRRLAGVRLRNQALATSGSGKQFFHHRGKRYGHVIDPRTGFPAGDLASLTVITDSAADADACGTGLFVAGTNEIETLSGEPWFPHAVLIRSGKRQDEVAINSLGEIEWADPPAEQNAE
jgi:thiamine biosynthesis lipoprotein